MTVIVNPGSGPVAEAGTGWTNTAEGAQKEAEQWLARLVADGIRDVALLPGSEVRDGRWVFRYQHAVTGVVVELETAGIDDWEAYRRERIFQPKTYWAGSSTGEPRVEDWQVDGFEIVKTLRQVTA